MPLQVPPDKTPGKIELTGRGNQISAVVRELLAGTYGVVPKERGAGSGTGIPNCLVYWNGGGDGDATPWRYEVRDMDGISVIAADEAATMQRMDIAYLKAPDGSPGIYYYDGTNTFRLWFVGEVPDLGDCVI